MAKSKVVFVCNNCGNESSKWLGKCPACGEWNSFFEEKVVETKATPRGVSATATKAEVVKLKDVETNQFERYKTGYEELDRVLRWRISSRLTCFTRWRARNRKVNTYFATL